MKKRSMIILALGIYFSASAQTQWKVDKAHSNIKFSVTHLVVSEVEGNFKSYEGTVTTKSATDFSDLQADINIAVNSINTDNDMRDTHLKSAEFFSAEKFPSITFKSASCKKITEKTFKLSGDLTITNITKKVTFDVTYNGTTKDPYGNTKAGFKASISINRFDYDLKWNTLTEAGGMVVGDEVKINVNLELSLQK